MDFGFFTRLALISIVFANLSVFAKVIQNASYVDVQDKVGNVVPSSVTTGIITYAEDRGAPNNVSESGNLVGNEAEPLNNLTGESRAVEENPVPFSSKNISGSKSAIGAIVISKVKVISAGAKSRENLTESEVETGVVSNSSEVNAGEKQNAYETETGNQSNNTEQMSYGIYVKTVSADTVVSGGQNSSYDSQTSELAIETVANAGGMGKGPSTNYSTEVGSSEQMTGSEVESYEQSTRSSAISTNQSNSSVIATSEEIRVTGSEMESYDRSNISSILTASEQLSNPEAEALDRSNGSNAESTNHSSSYNAETQSKAASLDVVSYNKSTDLKAGSEGKISSSDLTTSPKLTGIETVSRMISSKQQINDPKYTGVSAGYNSNAKGNSNLESNIKGPESNAFNVNKTPNSNNISNNKQNNTITAGSETGQEQADVDIPNIGEPGGRGEVAERTGGQDAGEQPERPEGIQLGPCARYPFRIEGNKVIFDVELNCQLSVDLDVAKQMGRYGQTSQEKAASNLFEMQTSSGTKAVEGTCPKLQTFVLTRGIVHIKTSANCHIIIYPDRVGAGSNEAVPTRSLFTETTG